VREAQRLRGFAQPLHHECAANPPTEPDTELEAAVARRAARPLLHVAGACGRSMFVGLHRCHGFVVAVEHTRGRGMWQGVMFVGLHLCFVVAVEPALFKAHRQRTPKFYSPRGQPLFVNSRCRAVRMCSCAPCVAPACFVEQCRWGRAGGEMLKCRGRQGRSGPVTGGSCWGASSARGRLVTACMSVQQWV
jgi:hypothetical protein